MKNLSLPLACLFALFLTACGGDYGKCTASALECKNALYKIAANEGEGEICSVHKQKTWVRGHLDDVYLWYPEVLEAPIDFYNSAEDYFKALLVTRKDRFSFSQPLVQATNFFQAGEEIGYGLNYIADNGRIRISYTDNLSPANKENVPRGAEIVSIDGVAIGKMDRKLRNEALFPSEMEQSHQFEFLPFGAAQSKTVQLTSRKINKQAVQTHKIFSNEQGRKFGYMQFNQHNFTAEGDLLLRFLQFQREGIQDLILDVRYNRGGYLYIAAEAASMIAGQQTKDKIFEKLIYNDKHPEKTAAPQSTMLFPETSRDKTFTLPHLNLPRVFLLTGPDTCSASESIINGLSPFIEVILIGGNSCGKPYGFTQRNQCGIAYFAIEFTGVNALGKGDYTKGFAPTCRVLDDFAHELGDEAEGLLSAALSYAKTGACPRTVARSAKHGSNIEQQNTPPYLLDQAWRNQRLLN